MPYLILLILLVISLLLQTTVLNSIAISGVKPDLVLIWVVFFSLFGGIYKGASFGFLAGLFEDLLLGRFIGMNALTKGLTGLLVGYIESKIFKENILVPVMVVLMASFVNESLFFIVGKALGFNINFSYWLTIVIPVAVYNTCIVPLLYKGFYKSVTSGKIKEII